MIIVADPDRRFRSLVAEQLGGSETIVDCSRLARVEEVLAQQPGVAPVVLLGPNLPAAPALALAERTQASSPEVSFVLVVNVLTTDLLQAALHAGVRDVLPGSFDLKQLLNAVERAKSLSEHIRARGNGSPGEAPPGARTITVFSSKGGCGKSFVASNLAVLLAERTKQPVALVDLDLDCGDLAVMLQLSPARTIYDAAQNLDRLDAEALQGYLTPHGSRVSLLGAPLEPGLVETISGDAVRAILRLLKESFRYIVIDSPDSFSDHVLAALDESDGCVLVTSMDVPSIKNLKLSLQTLQVLGYERDRVRLVLNRADSKVGLHIHEVEKVIGTHVDVAIPSSRDVPLSINRGVPLAIDNPKSPAVAEVGKILAAFDVQTEAAPVAGRLHLGRRK